MVHFYSRISVFLIGVLLGIFLGKQCIRIKDIIKFNATNKATSYELWLSHQKLKRESVLWDALRYGERKYNQESDFLFKRIKVLCIVLVQNLKNINGMKDTWTKGCQSLKLVEIVSQTDKFISIKRTSQNSSWVLLCKILRSVSLDFDWFLVVKDNTFVILENLRYYVAALNSSEPHYLGHLLKFWNTLYNSGQAGYVLSKGAMASLINTLNYTGCTMNAYWNREDFYLGKQLAELNITPSDTTDEDGLSTFHPYTFYQLFFPHDSYYQLSVFPQKCCSKHSITFKAVDGDKMYQYYYLIYKLQIFLYGHLGNRIPSCIPEDLVWTNFLKDHGHSNYNISNEEYYQIWENLIQDPHSFAAQMKKEMHMEYDDQN